MTDRKKLHLQAGFTIIEVIFAVLIVGILSAIAAPSWLAFTNRQRLNKASDAVLSALYKAQAEAKRTKFSYSVSFLSEQGKVPQVAIYRTDSTAVWSNLGGDIGLQPGQVLLYTNLSTATNKAAPAGTSLATTVKTIAFDYLGALQFGADTPLKVVVAEARAGTALDSKVTKRCVIIETLIGGMHTGQDNDCN